MGKACAQTDEVFDDHAKRVHRHQVIILNLEQHVVAAQTWTREFWFDCARQSVSLEVHYEEKGKTLETAGGVLSRKGP